MKGRNSQVSRLYMLLNIMDGAPHGLTVPEILQRINDRGFMVSKRTVYRDLQALEGAGFPVAEVEKDSESGLIRWTLYKKARIAQFLPMSRDEIHALTIASDLLKNVVSIDVYRHYRTAIGKISEKVQVAHEELQVA